MNVLRTVTFKLRLTALDKEAILNTMKAYTVAFSISAKWGFENHSWNKVDNHKATYKLTR
jgi:putative transposase